MKELVFSILGIVTVTAFGMIAGLIGGKYFLYISWFLMMMSGAMIAFSLINGWLPS